MDIFSCDKLMFAWKNGSSHGPPAPSQPLTVLHRRRPAVRRCLFGRPTPEDRWENRRTLRELEAQEIDRISEKYNFNIRTSTPKQGRYEWEDISGSGKLKIIHPSGAENIEATKLPEDDLRKALEFHCNENSQKLSECKDLPISSTLYSASPASSSSSSSLTATTVSSSSLLSSSSSTDEGLCLDSDPTNNTSSLVGRVRLCSRKRSDDGNLQITDFYPVCKRVRFSKKEEYNH